MVGDIDETAIPDIGLPIPPSRQEAHLGGLMFAVASRHRVDFRAYHGGRLGLLETASYSREISLDQGEVSRLMDGIWSLANRWRGLHELLLCRDTHKNKNELLSCHHCSPTGEMVDGIPWRRPSGSNSAQSSR